jgi:ABC transporter
LIYICKLHWDAIGAVRRAPGGLSKGSIEIEREDGSIDNVVKLNDVFYLPQRPYLVVGSLLEQVIYPLTVQEALVGRSLSQLTEAAAEILQGVGLDGWASEANGNRVLDWTSVLSGGEKQKLSIARLLFHQPTYVSSTHTAPPEHEYNADTNAKGFHRLLWTKAPARSVQMRKSRCSRSV